MGREVKLILNFESYLFDVKNIKCKAYNNSDFYGIIFYHNDLTYDLVHNKKLNWSRILINGDFGHFKDLPFNERTLKFLDFVEIRKI